MYLVVYFPIVRLFLYLTLSLRHFVAQVDIKTVFLNGILDEDVWIYPSRNIPGLPCRIYRLKKALYGLKQAHIAWHQRLCTDLYSIGFRELQDASCVFPRKKGNDSVFILVYEDDVLIFASSRSETEAVIRKWKCFYNLQRFDSVQHFLGTRLQWSYSSSSIASSLRISQESYTRSVLRRLGMEKCKPAATSTVEKFFEGYD